MKPHLHVTNHAFIRDLKSHLPTLGMTWEFLCEGAELPDFHQLLPFLDERFPAIRQATIDVLSKNGRPTRTEVENEMAKALALIVGTQAQDEGHNAKNTS